jgi:hypothetical protein
VKFTVYSSEANVFHLNRQLHASITYFNSLGFSRIKTASSFMQHLFELSDISWQLRNRYQTDAVILSSAQR